MDLSPSGQRAASSFARRRWRAGMVAGIRDYGPAMVATGVWGLVTGIALVKVGLTTSLALGMTLLVFAGSAQLSSLPLMLAGAPVWLIFAVAFVVNLRFVIFSAVLHPYFQRYRIWQRLLFGYFTSDLGFVLFSRRYADARIKGTTEQSGYFAGTAVANWSIWQGSSVAGILLASAIPSGWSLEFAAVVALISILVPMASNRPAVVSIAVASVVAWVAQPLPMRLGLVVAVVAGVVAGMLAERRARLGGSVAS